MPSDWNVDITGVRGTDGAAGPASSLTDAPSDGNLYGRSAGAWASGGTTGNLSIAAAAASSILVLNKPVSGNSCLVTGTYNGVNRWDLVLGDAAAESGSNVGSDFNIWRYDDAGAARTLVFNINRASGVTSIPRLEVAYGSTPALVNPALGTMAANVYSAQLYSINAYPDAAGWHVWAGGAYGHILAMTGNSLQLLISTTAPASGGLITGWGQYLFNPVGIQYCARQATNYFMFGWNDIVSGYASVGIDNNVWYAIGNGGSDERLKQDIAPSKYDCVATLKRIPLFQYRWKDHAEPGKPREVERRHDNLVPVGVVAQRLHAVAPHLAPRPFPEREEGQMHLWSVDQVNMLALLVGAVQQLSERVECLTIGTSTPSA
jgi:hypothetical protein